jgi:hypothetical protein
MDASALPLLEVAPVAITVAVVIWHFRIQRRTVAAEQEQARAPHA